MFFLAVLEEVPVALDLGEKMVLVVENEEIRGLRMVLLVPLKELYQNDGSQNLADHSAFSGVDSTTASVHILLHKNFVSPPSVVNGSEPFRKVMPAMTLDLGSLVDVSAHAT
jgi:hypothetical protein